MSKNNENKLVPRLRFPEFAMEGEWEILPLSKLSYEITEKTKGRCLVKTKKYINC